MFRITFMVVIGAVLILPKAGISQLDHSAHPYSDFSITTGVADTVSSLPDSLLAINKMGYEIRQIIKQNQSGPPAPGARKQVVTTQFDALHNEQHVYIFPAHGYTVKQLSDAIKNSFNILPDAITATLISAWVPVSQLNQVATRAEVLTIRAVTNPLTSGGGDEGNVVMRGNEARQKYKLKSADGSGVWVGVISNDCGNAEGITTSLQSTGKLPSGTALSIVDDGAAAPRPHEGAAMMEIVHQMAPKASIAFATGMGSMTAFATNIVALAKLGCSVICDDITYFEEPFFEDGTIASTIHTVVTNSDILYVAAAGNWGREVNSFTYSNTTSPSIVGLDGTTHTHQVNNFSGSYYNLVYLPANAKVDAVLQWDDSFTSPTNRFYLLIYDFTTKKIVAEAKSTDPLALQEIHYANPHASGYFGVIVEAASTPSGTVHLKLLTHSSNPYLTSSQKNGNSSILGHATSTDVITCGAVSASFTTAREIYSAKGPTDDMRDHTNHHKPDIVAIDQVTTDVNGFRVFSGTSAAAPQVAGIAAIVRSALNHSTMKTTEERSAHNVRDYLRLGNNRSNTAWQDPELGFGLSDAVNTLDQANP